MNMIPLISFLFIFLTACSDTEVSTFEYTTGDTGLSQTPVSVTIPFDHLSGSLCLEQGESLIPAQAERVSPSEVNIWWLSSQGAGKTVKYTIHKEESCSDSGFSWIRKNDLSVRLVYEDLAFLQYEHPVYKPEDIAATKKPYHHLFDPVQGTEITKGPGGLYSHHRGIYYGYNRVLADGNEYDMWHARDGERTEHKNILDEFAGPVMGGHILNIAWKDRNGNLLIDEQREIRVFMQNSSSYFVDFYSRLESRAGDVRLGGDLQHAGVHFRAAQDVADHPEQTFFIRPDALSHVPGNEELSEEDRVDLPWNAMSFRINGEEYTVAYMRHPSNPAGAEMSERTYGRFGEFVPHNLTEEIPFELRYRFWVVSGGTPSASEIERVYQAYINDR